MHPGWFYRRSLSSDEAKQIAASYINVIQQDREYLMDSLAKYGNIIVNRWKKKSQDKRQALLLEAIPNLCKKRWIIPRHGFTPEGKEIPPINSDGQMELRSLETRNHLLLNWLNLEVLKTNPAVLFALLHNRTAARLVLEAQAYLMTSLRKVVDGILQGIDKNTPLAVEKWISMVSMGFRHSNFAELWSPYTNQAFSSPPSFLLANLISLAQTRLDATIDHLWLLQTEPACMKRYIADMCHGAFYELTRDTGASWLVVRGILQAIKSYWRWGWVRNECERVKSIHDRFRDNIAQGEDLPSRYDKALSALKLLVVNDVNRRGGLLGSAIPQRPGFSHRYLGTRETKKQGPDIIEWRRKDGLLSDAKHMLENDPLDYCLFQLQARPDIQQKSNTWPKEVSIDHALLFSILEHHLAKSNIKEKSHLDEVLSNLLSDLAASHEMLAAIRLQRPLRRPRTLDEVLQSEKRKNWRAFNVKSHFTNDACAKLGKAFLKNFHEVKAPTGRKTWLG
ncbi:hypothetical protein BOTNAR_0044g00260 [Botryotinia narcissicola]|uniref:Uncharacterized protein n=1 Tax=Botryotinia narcissicola TaxID=278944 RepID=A0A4Z1J2E2_9HELO|nr:hypothetical protein BOTNAR_0044g00260 [Botryotinia narcissicola]